MMPGDERNSTVSGDSLTRLIENELARLDDDRVIGHIRRLLITPSPQTRAWDYGEPGEAYPCWLVLAHPESNTGIAYCEFGFGPKNPWGLLFLDGDGYLSMGMDSGWFRRFLDAYFDSIAATELPIWRVFQRRGNTQPQVPVTDEGSWEATWAEVKRLRKENPDSRYDCGQSVYE